MINRTNAFAGVLLAGLLGLGLYHQYASQAPAPQSGEPLIKLPLPDVDDDKKADLLYITQPTNGQAAVMLTHSVNNRTGQVIPLAVDGALTLSGEAPRWEIKDQAGRTRLTIGLVKSAPDAPPDLFVASDADAKRYIWMQRGFLKLDARTVTPGFAVGLLMVGDPKSTLSALTVDADAQGMWKQPTAEGPSVQVKFDKKDRISELTYDAPTYTCDFAIQPGQPLGDLCRWRLVPVLRLDRLQGRVQVRRKGRRLHRQVHLQLGRLDRVRELPDGLPLDRIG